MLVESKTNMLEQLPTTAEEPHPPETLRGYYVDPEGMQELLEADGVRPVTDEELYGYLASLSEEEIAELEERKEWLLSQKELRKQVHERLTSQISELYNGRLPDHLEKMLDGVPYALGFNQTAGASSVDDALRHLHKNGGVNMTGSSSIGQRFRLIDKFMPKEYLGTDRDSFAARFIEEGHYGAPSMGRFVGVFPVHSTEDRPPEDRLTEYAGIGFYAPSDLRIVGSKEGTEVVNPKYIAGFIDPNGDFWENAGFMKDDVSPELQRYQDAHPSSDAI